MITMSKTIQTAATNRRSTAMRLQMNANTAGRRYERFEPITIRAAARVVALAAAGRIETSDVAHHVAGLAILDTYNQGASPRRLFQLARRSAAFGPAGVPAPRRGGRTSSRAKAFDGRSPMPALSELSDDSAAALVLS
jgi:hypothetical protein